jgi:hypothetical protein
LLVAGDRAVRLLLCSLWTDYKLFGATNAPAAMNVARYGLNDHRVINWRKDPWLRFRPRPTIAVRVAMLFYVLKRQGLLNDAAKESPRTQHIVNLNRSGTIAALKAADFYICVARNCPNLRRVEKADVDVALGQKKYVGILAEVDANEFGGMGKRDE